MPQMAPMSWIMLFLFFSFMLININMMNYFSFHSSIKPSKVLIGQETPQQKNWKW